MADDPDRLVFRPVLLRLAAVMMAAFGVWWLVDILHSPLTRHTAAPLLLIIGGGTIVYAVGWRPAVVVQRDGVLLRNVMSDVWVPWAALDGIDTKYSLTLIAGERRYQSWAAPARMRPRRDPAMSPLFGRFGGLGGLGGGGLGGLDAAAGRTRSWPFPTPSPTLPSSAGPGRDPRSPSGAAAVLVEYRWESWRNLQESKGGGSTAGDPTAVIRWNRWIVGVILVSAALATVAALI